MNFQTAQQIDEVTILRMQVLIYRGRALSANQSYRLGRVVNQDPQKLLLPKND